ncbi:MAG: hypothetical protein PVH79_04735 [Candidatus Bathyarchaeota archaeon]
MEDRWDDPVRCAEFIEYFTSHDLEGTRGPDLEGLTRSDLEGIIRLLHGYYTHFAMESPPEVKESLRCSVQDVMEGMSIASGIEVDDEGKIVLNEEAWRVVKESPFLLRLLALNGDAI